MFYPLFLSILIASSAYGASGISLDLQNANTADVIRLIANFLPLNVVVSPLVQGTVSLHLHDVNPADTLNSLLKSSGLSKWQMDSVWYIAPADEIMKRKQEVVKTNEMEDELAILQTEVFVLKYAKASDVFSILQGEHALLTKRGKLGIDERTNTIFVHDGALGVKRIRYLIKQFDKPVQQVLIEARLASVDSDFERELGVNFSIIPTLEQTDKTTKATIQDVTHYSLSIAKLADASILDIKLAALENQGHAELISSPSLFTANRQLASIEAGEEVPYQEVSESGGTAVVFKKAVLGLKVTPQVLPGDKVLLQLQVNQDRPSNKMVLGMPTISTRQIATNVLAKNGQTIVLGGIYEMNSEKAQRSLPFLGNIPIIGELLFKQQNTRKNKRELLIFVTPRIIKQEDEDWAD